MTYGGFLILAGIAIMLLDKLQGRKSNRVRDDGEIKIGIFSAKGGVGFLIFVVGVLVYLIEEGFLKFS